MKIRTLVLLLVEAVIGTACAPLEQAPLVYSSKVTLGVDLSTASSEQPGLSANLGYKQVDAAYVPVAVARRCEGESLNGGDAKENSASRCGGPNYAIVRIMGGAVDHDGASGPSQEPRPKLEVSRRLTAAKETMADDLWTGPERGPTSPTSAASHADKHDAYSVFGSFDAGTKVGVGAEAGGAGKADSGITIGKVFSTGVASQNITVGISRYYKSLALARIIDSYRDCMNTTEKRLMASGLPADRTQAKDSEKELAQKAFADCSRLLELAGKDTPGG